MPFRTALRSLPAILALMAPAACSASAPQFKPTDPRSPLVLVRTIPLPDTKGRIDHLAIDIAHQRLFVAEVANGTVDTVDLKAGKVIGRVSGLLEPQGVAWLPNTGEVVVACGDGTVHFYDPAMQHETFVIHLGDDADNVRIDERNGQVVVGYGSGALATIDPASHKVIGRVAFGGHPEGFRLYEGKAFVNVPDDGAVLAVDRDTGKVIAHWPTGLRRLNFPMALEPEGKAIMIAYRLPATLARIDTSTGVTMTSQATCGDSDDVFLDGERALVVCGAGHVDIVRGDRTEAAVKTSGGARTGLYVPDIRTLFVAAPARNGVPARLLELRLRSTDTLSIPTSSSK